MDKWKYLPDFTDITQIKRLRPKTEVYQKTAKEGELWDNRIKVPDRLTVFQVYYVREDFLRVTELYTSKTTKLPPHNLIGKPIVLSRIELNGRLGYVYDRFKKELVPIDRKFLRFPTDNDVHLPSYQYSFQQIGLILLKHPSVWSAIHSVSSYELTLAEPFDITIPMTRDLRISYLLICWVELNVAGRLCAGAEETYQRLLRDKQDFKTEHFRNFVRRVQRRSTSKVQMIRQIADYVGT